MDSARTAAGVLAACLLGSLVAGAAPAASAAGDVVIAEPTVRITEVVPDRSAGDRVATAAAGERVVVAGVTNLQPDENLILVTVRRTGPGGETVAVEETATWGRDGEWVVDVDPEDLSPGRYVVRAEAAGAADVARLRVTAATPTETPTPAPTPSPTPTVTPTPPPTVTSTAGETADPTPVTTGTTAADGDALVFLTLLVLAALVLCGAALAALVGE